MELQYDSDDIVSNFYSDSVIFITGGTGFLGKVLVEKLLRVFSIKRVYLLVRVKNNMTVNERLEQFFQESIFDRLRKEDTTAIDKVKAIEANFDAPDLNISDENKTVIWNEVDVVFNVVASVKFNEKLRDAVEINVLGTKKILDLVMGIKHLKAFLHISTLYSNCDRKMIEEKVYESSIEYEKVIAITRILDDSNLEKVQHCLVGKMPNTYTMTKKCSENLVNHKAHGLPAGIFRPPIVLSTYKEPVPGWTDNLYGPSGLCAGAVRGLVHVIFGNGHKVANLVPADYCVNAMIAAAWDTNRRFKSRMLQSQCIPVYNYIYDKNNLTWGKYMHSVRKGLHQPLDKSFWYYSYVIVPWGPLFELCNMALHTVPGYVMDLIALILGKKRVYAKGYEKLGRVIHMMSYFGLREWKFQNQNIDQLATLLKLHQQMPAKKLANVSNSLACEKISRDEFAINDKNGLQIDSRDHRKDNRNKKNGRSQLKTHPYLEFDMRTINWNEYFHHYLPGIKKYFFKERLTDNAKCIKHYRRLRLMHILFKSVVTLFVVYLGKSMLWKTILKFLLMLQ